MLTKMQIIVDKNATIVYNEYVRLIKALTKQGVKRWLSESKKGHFLIFRWLRNVDISMFLTFFIPKKVKSL